MTVLELIRLGGAPGVIAALLVAVIWLARELRKDAAERIACAEKYAESLQKVQAEHAAMLAVLQGAHVAELSRVHEARVDEMQQVTRAADGISELIQVIRAADARKEGRK